MNEQPTVIVIDAMDRLSNFTSPKAKEQLKVLKQLKAKSAPLGSDLSGTPMTLPWLYTPSDFADAHGFDGLPLPRAPDLRREVMVVTRACSRVECVTLCSV